MKTLLNLFFVIAVNVSFSQETQHLEGSNQYKSENQVEQIKDFRESLEMEVNVYPNPSTGTVFLQGLPGTTITIYSAQGVYVGTWVLSEGMSATKAELSQGSFICVMTNGDKQVTKRVVVL